jgi:hypothetical protein
MMAKNCKGIITGFGLDSYSLALSSLTRYWNHFQIDSSKIEVKSFSFKKLINLMMW